MHRGTRSVFARLRSSSAAATARAVPRVAALRDRLANEQSTLHDFVASSSTPLPAELPSSSAATLLPAQQQQQQQQPRRHRRLLAGEEASAQPPNPLLVDNFARHHTYLRMSLTERCSLRCVYCMPEDGVNLTPQSRLLSADEAVRLARVFVTAGVTKIRLTGGEPTVRRDLPEVIGA